MLEKKNNPFPVLFCFQNGQCNVFSNYTLVPPQGRGNRFMTQFRVSSFVDKCYVTFKGKNSVEFYGSVPKHLHE